MKYFFRVLTFALILSALAVGPDSKAQSTRTLAAPGSVSFTFQKGDQTNQQYTTVQILDLNGNPQPGQPFDFYFSDQADGLGVTATTSSGTAGLIVAAVSTTPTPNAQISYVVSTTPTVASSQVPMHFITDNNGKAEIGVIDTGKTNWFPVVLTDGPAPLIAVGAKMTTANYK